VQTYSGITDNQKETPVFRKFISCVKHLLLLLHILVDFEAASVFDKYCLKNVSSAGITSSRAVELVEITSAS